MILGVAINPHEDVNARYIIQPTSIKRDTLEIISVWKCPNCGHSEYFEAPVD